MHEMRWHRTQEDNCEIQSDCIVEEGNSCAHVNRFRKVARSDTSCFVFGPTLCQIGSS
jgi:hypothetical protein